jgi:hypothetical protein
MLRDDLLKLAQEVPATRRHLMPILKRAKDFPSQNALREYLKEHPQADPKRHQVVETKPKEKSQKEKSDGKTPSTSVVEKAKAKAKKIPPEVKDRLNEYHLDVVGDDIDQAINIAQKIIEGVDKSADVCKLSPPVCQGNLGLSRDKMPQIPGDLSVKQMLKATNKDGTPDEGTRAKGRAAVEAGADPDDDRTILKQMLDTFKSEGVKIEPKKIPVGQLKATQSEIKAGKTFGMADAHLKGKFPSIGDQIVISSDGHILDGHHRWAALLTIDPSRTMNVIQVDMPMKEMLDRADELPGVYREDFQGKPIALPDEIKKRKDKYHKKTQRGKNASVLREEIIRLAHEFPETRKHLVPILQHEAMTMEKKSGQKHKPDPKVPKFGPKDLGVQEYHARANPIDFPREWYDSAVDLVYEEKVPPDLQEWGHQEWSQVYRRTEKRLKDRIESEIRKEDEEDKANGTRRITDQITQARINAHHEMINDWMTRGWNQVTSKHREDIHKNNSKQKKQKEKSEKGTLKERALKLFKRYKDEHPKTEKTPQDFAEELKKKAGFQFSADR